MIIKELRLIDYRNYKSEKIKFHEKTNILVGKNAQGKTNLLEGIYICARGYSFKSNKEDQLIRFGTNQSYLKALIDSRGRRKTVEFKISESDKKRIRINEIEIENLTEMRSQFGVVIFSPEDLKIVKDTPLLRRRFMDNIISNNDIVYKKHLSDYNKIRGQKNELLKKTKNKYFNQILSAINKNMAQVGALVGIYRYKYLNILKSFAQGYHDILTSGREKLEIEYTNNYTDSFKSLKDIEDSYSLRLKENTHREMEQYTSIYGPHKDDFIFKINGLDAKIYASQGQQRTVMLSLKLAEASLIKEVTKLKPILLLDDVFSELDNQRASLLVESIKEYQTIITTNTLINIDIKNMKGNVYSIVSGRVISSKERKNDGE